MTEAVNGQRDSAITNIIQYKNTKGKLEVHVISQWEGGMQNKSSVEHIPRVLYVDMPIERDKDAALPLN